MTDNRKDYDAECEQHRRRMQDENVDHVRALRDWLFVFEVLLAIGFGAFMLGMLVY